MTYQRLENAIQQAAEAITEGRDAVQGLRSSALETNDLANAKIGPSIWLLRHLLWAFALGLSNITHCRRKTTQSISCTGQESRLFRSLR